MENFKNKFIDFLNTDLSKKLDLLDLSISFKELSLLLKSNLTISDSIKILSTTAPSLKLQKIFYGINLDLQKGDELYIAFEKTKKFDEFFITLIKAGENSEKLDEVFFYLSEYYEQKYRLRNKIISLLTYPVILLFITILVLTFMIFNVIPMFVSIFRDSEIELPIVTRILISFIDFFKNYYLYIFLVILFLIFLFKRLNREEKFRLFLGRILFKIPYFKNHYKNYLTSIIARNLTILMKGHIDIVNSLNIIKDSSRNLFLKNHMEGAIIKIEDGNSVSDSLENDIIFNSAFINMLKVGEDSEKIVDLLKGATEYYEQKINYSIDKILQLLQPIIIIIIAVFIAFIVFAIALPIFDLSNGINIS